jgi:prepilin-type processing-associated H-X9-DG protein
MWRENGERTVFHCPARPSQYVPGLFGAPGINQYPLGYGYNELGTGWHTAAPQLGLGFTVEISGYENGSFGAPPGTRSYITSANIRRPANLIAMGDGVGVGWLTPNYPLFSKSSFQGPHVSTKANAVLVDGHVEDRREELWNAENDLARGNWNNDNLPHPETW